MIDHFPLDLCRLPSLGGAYRVGRGPTPDPPTSEVVWHYTDAGGAIGILKQEELWATSTSFLNDKREFRHGADLLRSLFVRVAREARGVRSAELDYLERVVDAAASAAPEGYYVACASEAEDSLSQWRAYGRSVGYAVGLHARCNDWAVYVEGTPPGFEVDLPLDNGTHLRWGRVEYDEERQVRLLLRGIAFVLRQGSTNVELDRRNRHGDDAATGTLRKLLLYCKDPAFRDEREVRLVVAIDEYTKLQFRTGALGITSYVPLVQATARPKTFNYAIPVGDRRPLPVVETYTGPSPYQASAHQGMGDLLEATHRLSVRLHTSRAPSR